MGAVETSIRLTDKMTPALRGITQALNLTISSFESMQRASGKAIDTTSLQSARRAINNVEREIDEANASQTRFNNNSRTIVSIVKRIEAGFDKVVNAIGQVSTQMQGIASTTRKINAGQQQLTNTVRRGNQAMQQTANSIYRANINQIRLTSSFKQGITNSQRLRQTTDSIDTAINQNTSAQKRFNDSVNKGTSGMSALIGKVKSLAGAYLGVQALGGVFSLSDTLTSIGVRLDQINDGTHTTAQLQEKVYQSAMRSRASYADMADAIARMGMLTDGVFSSNDELIQFTETLNKMYGVSKATTEQMSAGTLQLQQALSSGVLQGDEYKSIRENAPLVGKAIADYLGVAQSKLKELSRDGKLTADVVKNAILNASKDINLMFAEMPVSWGEAWTLMKNYAVRAFEPVLKLIGKITTSKRFIKFANSVANAIEWVANCIERVYTTVAPVIGWVFDKIQSIGGFIARNWSVISPIIYGIVGAMTAWKLVTWAVTGAIWLKNIAMGAYKTIVLITTGLMGLLSGATLAETAATAGATAAQWGLNVAMYSCPATWVVLAIMAIIGVVIALVVALYLGVAVFNKLAGTSISATGIIAGAVMYAYATIYNYIALVWNVIASFAEFFMNVFKHPTYSVKRLFVNLGLAFVGVFKAGAKMADNFGNALVKAVNWAVDKCIDFLNTLYSALPDKAKEWLGISHFKAKIIEKPETLYQDLASDWENKLNSYIKEEPADYWKAKRMEYKDTYDYAKMGYEWGDQMSEKLEKALSLENLMKALKGDTSGIEKALLGNGGKGNGIGDKLDDLNKNVKGIGDDTSKIANDSELSFMRDMAEREAINRYTLANQKFNITNNNNISNGMDLEAVKTALGRELAEKISAGANKVHA